MSKKERQTSKFGIDFKKYLFCCCCNLSSDDIFLRGQDPVFQKVDSTIYCIKYLYPLDSAIGFPNTYPVNSDLSGGLRYPTFQQLWLGLKMGMDFKGQL